MRTLPVIFLTLFFLLTGTAARASVTVALVVPKAGNYVEQGAELIKGVQQAVDEINNNGGLLGEKLDLLTIDDQCNDSIAVSTAQMLTVIRQKSIKLVIGPYCANSFDQVADIYAKAKIFQIIPTTVNYAQAKTIKKGLVKMLGYTNQQAKDFFAYYNAELAGEKLAVIYNSDDEESVDEATAVNEEFRKHGKLVVLKNYTYNMTGEDYKELAKMVLADGNRAAFILGTPKNIRKTAYALKNYDEDFLVFANKYTATKDYFEYMGNLANGTYFMQLRGKNEDPDFAETLVKLRLAGFEADGLSLYGYSAVKLWEALVKQENSFGYNKLSAGVNNKDIQTEFGSKMFHNGTPDTNESYAIYKYENGSMHSVY